ncbi:unnamed protein product, partial [Sphagnum jensenii]
ENKTMTNETLNVYWSITNGLMPFGGIFGGLSSGFVADYFGRKKGLLAVNVLVIISTLLNVISKPVMNYYTLLVARFIAGVYSGLFIGIQAIYASECSSKNIRGIAGTINHMSVYLGIIIANIIGLPQLLGTQSLWPYLVGFTLIPAIVHMGLFFTSESPKYFFINKNNPNQAEKVLKKLRNNNVDLINYELNELKIEKEIRLHQTDTPWRSFFTNRSLYRPLIVAIGIQISQQFSGINVVVFYSNEIFRNVGLKGLWPIYGAIILNVVSMIMLLVSIFLIEKAGRKPLLLISLLGMCICCILLTLFRVFGNEEHRQWLNFMTLASAVFYVAFFSIGL